MATLTFNDLDVGEMIVGLLVNVLVMQWWICKPAIVSAGVDLQDPAAQRLAADMVVDLVLQRFGDSKAAGKLERQKEQLAVLLIETMQKAPPPPPAGSHLKLVP